MSYQLAYLMFKPLEPTQFCQRWIPIRTGKNPEEYGYRKECYEMLSELTGYSNNTCNDWLSRPEKCPDLVKSYLRVIDALWQIQQLSNLPIDHIQE